MNRATCCGYFAGIREDTGKEVEMLRKVLGVLWICFFVFCHEYGYAQDIDLQLKMPSDTYSPGMRFKLDLEVRNHGPDYHDCHLFVVLTMGTGDYWFYPSWCQYPDEIDWESISIYGSTDFVKPIIPAFEWPSGAGEFDGAMFMSAIVFDGILISNLAQVTFGWTATSPPTPTPTATPTPIPVPPNFVYIPPGTFQMGSTDDEMCRDGDEGPVHQVTISHGFYLQAKEVTQRQWINLFGNNPSFHYDCLNCPVEDITWYDCCIFCNRMSVAEGLEPCYYSDSSYSTVFDGTPPVEEGHVFWKQDANGYRLPTEAEWEYACRAGTTTSYYSGQDIINCQVDPNLDPLAWYSNNSYSGDWNFSQPVGLKQPNAWDVYDMYGNVWEWCWDNYEGEYYKSSPPVDPTGPDQGTFRVIRGGSFDDNPDDCRSASRSFELPGDASWMIGFRPMRLTDF